jgi:hypothetical protein
LVQEKSSGGNHNLSPLSQCILEQASTKQSLYAMARLLSPVSNTLDTFDVSSDIFDTIGVNPLKPYYVKNLFLDSMLLSWNNLSVTSDGKKLLKNKIMKLIEM